MENLIVIPKNEKQLPLLKAFLEEMKINFKSEKFYNKELDSELSVKIEKARKEKEKGELITIDPHNLWGSI